MPTLQIANSLVRPGGMEWHKTYSTNVKCLRMYKIHEEVPTLQGQGMGVLPLTMECSQARSTSQDCLGDLDEALSFLLPTFHCADIFLAAVNGSVSSDATTISQKQ